MTTTAAWKCETCFDTETIDQGGREIACPDCQTVTIRLRGLAHGLGEIGEQYATAIDYTSTTITFAAATRAAIVADASRVLAAALSEAKIHGLSGRNHITSGPVAILKRIRATA